MIRHRIQKTFDGTAGGFFAKSDGLAQDLKFMQVSVAGRTTGTVTMSAKADGGEAVEAITDGTIDLAGGEYTKFPVGAFDELHFTPSAAGDDFTVTLNMWLQ